MSTQLTLPERAKAALNSAEHEKVLVTLAKSTKDITEIKDVDGRAQVHGAYMVLKTRRGDIRGTGKAARDDATKFSKAIITEEDRLVGLIEPEEKRLQALRDAWDQAREQERREKAQAEQRRKDGIRAKIDEMRAVPLNLMDAPADKIATALDDLEAFEVTADVFAEFVDAAHAARAEVVGKLKGMHEAAVRREEEADRLARDRDELERQRAEHAEILRQQAEVRQREEAERERLAAEAEAARAEQERIDRKRREAEEARARAEREAEQRKLDEQRAEIARQQAAIDAERQRIADEEAARLRAEEAAAAAKRRAAEEAAQAARRAQAEREAAERREREAAETAVRNAAPALLEALEYCVADLIECAEELCASASSPMVRHIKLARAAIAVARQTEAQREAA